MSDFVFLHQEKINFRFLKLLKPLTFKDIILNIYKKKEERPCYIICSFCIQHTFMVGVTAISKITAKNIRPVTLEFYVLVK